MALIGRGAIQMIKNKEKIVQEKTEKLAKQIKTYVDELDNLSDSNEFNIDNIEKKWGDLEDYTKQVYKEINDEVVQQYNEKKIIKSKKENMPRKG